MRAVQHLLRKLDGVEAGFAKPYSLIIPQQHFSVGVVELNKLIVGHLKIEKPKSKHPNCNNAVNGIIQQITRLTRKKRRRK